ncbi:MAG: amino acid-binding protein, partial [Methanobacteriota archaeon]
MIVSMTLELKDIPGQLVLALAPISELHGNIMSV